MKYTRALAATLAAVVTTFTLSSCEIPEDGGTAADKASVNQKKGKNAKEGKEGKAENASTEKKDSAPKETAGQENARKSAESYLDMSAFSRTGLIKQLKFEGYSEKDAAYGVDAQKANWNKQAAASAESYLDMSSFSRQGLIDQLVFEGFTPEQAAFGASQNGF